MRWTGIFRTPATCAPVVAFTLLLSFPLWPLLKSSHRSSPDRTLRPQPSPNYLPTWYLPGPQDDLDGGRRRSEKENRAVRAYMREVTEGRGLKAGGERPQGKIGGKKWVSMGLCFSKNTHLHNKGKYPYAAVTPLAILLWKHFTDVKVLVYLVYQEQHSLQTVLDDYASSLENAGATVEQVPTGKIDCVLMSQLIRLFAFRHPKVRDGDVVTTMDVNAFVMTPSILDPLREFPHLRVWVFQYHETVHLQGVKGETFNENLISMRASTWKQVLEVGSSQSLEDWLDDRVAEFGLNSSDNSWYYDQFITTLSILRSRLCTAPEYSGLWRNPGVTFDPSLDDEDTCYHGYGYKDCNRNIHVVFGGCKWWHFYPDQTFDEHVRKFHELTNDTYSFRFMNPYEEGGDSIS